MDKNIFESCCHWTSMHIFFDRKQQLYILIEKEVQKKDEESSLQR